MDKDQALNTMINNMPEKTGKTLNEWLAILSNENFTKHSQAVSYLKADYGVTYGYANTIVALSKENNDSVEDLVVNQYKGKEALMPIYELLISEMKKFGDDVFISPKKATVSMIRKHQFALIKPATKSRIDLGFKLKGVEITPRLESSGPFGTMCTHRVRLASVDDVDQELVDWLNLAYEKSI